MSLSACPSKTCPETHTQLASAGERRRRFVSQFLTAVAALQAASLGGVARAATSADERSFYANFRGLKLQDQSGRAFDTNRLLGRTVLVNFVYTGCSTTCPVQTRALVELQRQLAPVMRERLQLLSVSLDPLSDTPKVLKDYAQRMGVDPSHWSFVTGRPADIERVSTALQLFRPGADARRPEDHATALWLIDRQGQLRLRYSGNPPDLKRLLREIPALDGLTRAAGA